MKEKLNIICLWLRLAIKLLINYFRLNDDISNNYSICKNISKDIIKLANINLNVIGKDNIGNVDNTFLLTSNHRSFFDIFLLIASLNKPVSFAAASKLYSFPVLNKFMMSIGCIPINTYSNNILELKEQLRQMVKHLKEHSLILFPEGECNYKNNEIKEFKKGGFITIEKTNAYIIPTYIHIKEFTHIKHWCVPKGNVTIIFGKPFNPKTLNDDKITSSFLAEYTREKVEELKINLK